MNELNKIESVLNAPDRTEEETLGVFIAFHANLEAHRLADELTAEGKMLGSRKTFVDQKQDEIGEELLKTAYSIGRTFTEASLVLHEFFKDLPEDKQNKYKEEILKGMDTLKTLNEDIGILKTRADLRSARTIQEVLSFSFEMLEWMYGVGQRCFNQEELEKAHAIFTVLVYLNGVSPDAWMALGLTQRKMNKISEAAISFSLASSLDPTSLPIRYNLLEAYIDLSLFDKADEELVQLENRIKEQNRKDLEPLVEHFKTTLGKKGKYL